MGIFKVNVLSVFLLMIHSSALNSLAAVHTVTGRVLAAITLFAVYPFYIYCNFSGYIDLVIGIARFRASAA